MDAKAHAEQLVANLAEQANLELSPQQSKFWSCMLTAALTCLPTFISALTKCLAENTNPPGEGYNPGDRQRCQ